MFDIGFSELLVIGVVALIVLGPERLPKVARTAGHLFGRFQRYVSDVKAEIRREMHNEEIMKLETSLKEAKEALTGVEQSIRQEISQTGALLKAVPEEVGSLEFVEEPKPVEVARGVPAQGENPASTESSQLALPLPPAEGEGQASPSATRS
mgnify:CR=1 FL=1